MRSLQTPLLHGRIKELRRGHPEEDEAEECQFWLHRHLV